MHQRVVVTGIGLITPLGNGVDSFWNNCLSAPDIVSTVPQHWHEYAPLNSRIWTSLEKTDFSRYGLNRVDMMQQDMSSILCLATTRQALDHANLSYTLLNDRKNIYSIDTVDPFRAGTFIGTGVGGATSLIDAQANHVFTRPRKMIEQIKHTLQQTSSPKDLFPIIETITQSMRMPPRFNPFIVSMIMPNACASNTAIRYSIKGPNATNCTACASGTVAVGQGFQAIRNADVDFAIAGGVEYLGDRFGGIFRGFDSAKTLVHDYDDPQTANRPFDTKRSGFLFSEGGCAIVILESLQRAQQRNASIIAEITGYAESFDAHNIMIMEPEGQSITRMILSALKQAQCSPSQIDYINAHGTGTVVNDDIETKIIENLFGKKPLINSTKSLIGHTIGAAGAIETAVTALTLFHHTAHTNKNLHEPIAELNFAQSVSQYPFEYALTQSFAFGGNNAALVLKKYVP